uniref:Uncharacterized protein n=1 Tax=Caenorhabditis japonica TaxID=281687 RepID=A0A8R1IHU7_CAEJA
MPQVSYHKAVSAPFGACEEQRLLPILNRMTLLWSLSPSNVLFYFLSPQPILVWCELVQSRVLFSISVRVGGGQEVSK